MEMKIKALSPKIGAEIPAPFYASGGAAAMDLHACIDEAVIIEAKGKTVIPVGFAIALPSADYVALIYGRSGLGVKHGITLTNCVGVVDSDYRGEIVVALENKSEVACTVSPGDRIAQMMITPVVRPNLQWVGELDETPRGEGGFGSTGR